MRIWLVALMLVPLSLAQVPEIPELPPAPEPPEPPGPPDPPDPTQYVPPIPEPPAIPATGPIPVTPAHEYERQVWSDGGGIRKWDGYDLRELGAWDAYRGEDGVLLRLQIVGGNATGLHDGAAIYGHITGNATAEVALWTEDHMTWQSNHTIEVVRSRAIPMTAEEATLTGAQFHHDIEIFVPLSAMQAQIGSQLTDWTWSSFAGLGTDAAQVDVAPGGYYVPGGPAEAPEPDAEGEFGNESLTVTASPISYFVGGAGWHLEATGQWTDDKVWIIVQNPYNTSQWVDVSVPSVSQSYQSSGFALPALGNVTLWYDVPREAEARSLDWALMSHIGGFARLRADVPALPPPPEEPDPEPEPAPEPVPLQRTDVRIEEPIRTDVLPDDPAPSGGQDTPGLLLPVMALALLGAALRRR